METYIKYKRINESVDITKLDEFFDDLIKGGWEIIYYHEREIYEDKKFFDMKEVSASYLPVVVLVGKRASQIKNVL